MSLKPLDLQTLFVKMNEVSKSVAASENAASQLQDKEAEKLKKENQKRIDQVNETEEEKADRKIKDQESKSGRKSSDNKSKITEKKKTKEESGKKIFIEDSDMGQHIDISS